MKIKTTEIFLICPYCKKKAPLVDSKVIYGGTSYGNAYLCKPCYAWVMCHKGTVSTPLGTLADYDLREYRKKCHERIDYFWKNGMATRKEVYIKLAKYMNVDLKNCHIAMFNTEQCKQLLKWNGVKNGQ